MPIMDMGTWKIRTFATFKNKARSDLLKSIDTALQTYATQKTPASLNALHGIVGGLDTDDAGLADSLVRDAIADLKAQVRDSLGADVAQGRYPPAVYPAAYKAFRDAIQFDHNSTPQFARCFANWTQRTSVDWGTTYQEFGPSAAIAYLRRPSSSGHTFQRTGTGHSFIEVRIPLRPQPGGAFSATAQHEWNKHIRSSWSGATLKVSPTQSYTLDIAIEWMDEGEVWANGISEVATPPLPPPADWKAKKTQMTAHRTGTSVGTPHMAQFGTGDRQAILHEFGHLIGNCDEYNTRQYMGQDVAGHFDKDPFTTNSIMNNTSEQGMVFVRHYHSIKAMIERWLNLPENSTQVWWPGCLEGPPQMVKSPTLL